MPNQATAQRARDADEAEDQDDEDLERLAFGEVVLRDAEVVDDDRADEELEDQDELDLRDEVRLAGLVDQLAHLEHRLVDRRVLERLVDREREDHPDDADADSAVEQRRAGRAAQEAGDRRVAEVGDDEVGFTAVMGGRRGGAGRAGMAGPHVLLREAGSPRNQVMTTAGDCDERERDTRLELRVCETTFTESSPSFGKLEGLAARTRANSRSTRTDASARLVLRPLSTLELTGYAGRSGALIPRFSARVNGTLRAASSPCDKQVTRRPPTSVAKDFVGFGAPTVRLFGRGVGRRVRGGPVRTRVGWW